MDCKICDPAIDDWNVCLQCGYELAGAAEWMDELTGEGFSDDNELFLDLSTGYDKYLNSFFAGAQMPFRAQSPGKGVVRINSPLFTWLRKEDWP